MINFSILGHLAWTPENVDDWNGAEFTFYVWVWVRKVFLSSVDTMKSSWAGCNVFFGISRMLQFIDSTVAFSTLAIMLVGLSALGTLIEQISVIALGGKTFPDNLGLVIVINSFFRLE